MENIEKIRELFENEDLIKEMVMIGEPEDLQKWFFDHGAELSLDEVNKLKEEINKLKREVLNEDNLSGDGELFEDDLEAISGGGMFDTFRKYVKKMREGAEEILRRLKGED